MRKENVEAAIRIMKRAGRVDMQCFQSGVFNLSYPEKLAKTEEGLHSCGNSACFAGWLAVSPEFQAEGGGVGFMGMPLFVDDDGKKVGGAGAVGRFLGISEGLADNLVHGVQNDFYDKPFEDVTAKDVIDKLIQILAGDLR